MSSLENRSQQLIDSGKSDIAEGIDGATSMMYFTAFKILNGLNVLVTAVASIFWVPVYFIYMLTHSAWGIKNILLGLPFPIICSIVIALILKALDSLFVFAFTDQKYQDEYT